MRIRRIAQNIKEKIRKILPINVAYFNKAVAPGK